MSSTANPQPLTSSRRGPLTGEITPPGDKSISHRAIMLGGIAEGMTTIRGLLEGEDVLCTVAALHELGASILKGIDGVWTVKGIGLDNLKAPQKTLDMGNSGTAARLLMGLLAGRPFSSSFTGDASLCTRPMGRVITPLSQMGATFESHEGKMPLTVRGSEAPKAITYKLPVASAQVKSAVLFAGLSASGTTKIIEVTPTRDHSENMLRHFGADIEVTKDADGADVIALAGHPKLSGQTIVVPSDPSSAAFPLVAALLSDGSNITLRHVGLNARRAGLIDTLLEMGASIGIENKRDEGGEPVADLLVRGGKLCGITVPAARAASMIDEYPILSVAAACAAGITRMCGLGELRVKESDRLALMAEGLKQCGVKVEVEGDDLIVYGNGAPPAGGAKVITAMDHRIAMSFLILGSVTDQPVTVDDGAFIATSFPHFVEEMNRLGLAIYPSSGT